MLIEDFVSFSQQVAQLIAYETTKLKHSGGDGDGDGDGGGVNHPRIEGIQVVINENDKRGPQFVYGGVVFQFARDQHRVLSGVGDGVGVGGEEDEEELIQKSRANEIRAINAWIQRANFSHRLQSSSSNSLRVNIHTPLMAIFYIQGRCMVASALTRLQTLHYGVGVQVRDQEKVNAAISAVVRRSIHAMANAFNLKEHVVTRAEEEKEKKEKKQVLGGDGDGKRYTMEVGADFEGVCCVVVCGVWCGVWCHWNSFAHSLTRS